MAMLRVQGLDGVAVDCCAVSKKFLTSSKLGIGEIVKKSADPSILLSFRCNNVNYCIYHSVLHTSLLLNAIFSHVVGADSQANPGRNLSLHCPE